MTKHPSLPSLMRARTLGDYVLCRKLIKRHIDDLDTPSLESYLDVTPADLLETYNGERAGYLMSGKASGLIGGIAYKGLSTDCAVLNYFYVVPEARGRGVGKQLLGAALMEIKLASYREIVLSTMPFLAAAKSLYEQFGFEQTAPRFSDVPDAIFLRNSV